jgi:ABC-type methionine transport system ATPase subunit
MTSISPGWKVTCYFMAFLEVTIAAGPDQVQQPWMWRLAQDFPISVNLKKANVSEDYGNLLVELEGSVEELQRAVAWLMTTGLRVEAMTRAMGI